MDRFLAGELCRESVVSRDFWLEIYIFKYLHLAERKLKQKYGFMNWIYVFLLNVENQHQGSSSGDNTP